ncbi:MAG: outer membrane beta-barrel protein [Candidatus Babeliales bacterium]|nr:outer membrane beta-barrel protein [Candidatus Babeliales bacterium]
MKKNIFLLLMPFLFFLSAHGQYQQSNDETFCIDQTNLYGKFLSGANFLKKTITDGNRSTFKTGYIIDALLGYRWSCGLRLEAEYAFRKNAIKKIDFYIEGCSSNGHFKNSSLMANLLWDVPLYSCECAFENIKPFVGVGIGYDFQKINSSNSRIIFCQKWNNLSWQAMAGLTFPIFCNTDITLEYKFHQGGNHFYNNAIGIGLVYNFDF